MFYVVLTLKADNTSSSTFRAVPTDYLRLKSGDTASPPTINYTLPLSVDAGQTNVTGTATFSMPQGSTAFTLIFLADPSDTPAQASVAFSIK
jgi:hypothetical protein